MGELTRYPKKDSKLLIYTSQTIDLSVEGNKAEGPREKQSLVNTPDWSPTR